MTTWDEYLKAARELEQISDGKQSANAAESTESGVSNRIDRLNTRAGRQAEEIQQLAARLKLPRQVLAPSTRESSRFGGSVDDELASAESNLEDAGVALADARRLATSGRWLPDWHPAARATLIYALVTVLLTSAAAFALALDSRQSAWDLFSLACAVPPIAMAIGAALCHVASSARIKDSDEEWQGALAGAAVTLAIPLAVGLFF